MDTSIKIMTGDALRALKSLPNEQIHTCITSPPYYGLRDYGIDGQIGLEKSVQEYIKHLVDIFNEVHRVLRADGTLWLNLGDSYATRSGNYPPTNTRNKVGHTEKRVPEGYKYKDLMGIPWRVALALQESGEWYLRSDIIWHKTNAMPESVKDRPTRAHEYIFLLSKEEKYYYDGDAIKEDCTGHKGNARTFRGGGAYTGTRAYQNSLLVSRESHGNVTNISGKRNKRDVWNVATAHFAEAHYATFPPELIRPCILAGCPVGGIILDPFAGSGTTGIVAQEEERDFIGIDINPDYVTMAMRRIKEAEEKGIQLQLFNQLEL